MTDGAAIWADALLAAALFAVDPVGCGGVVLRARAGPVREQWLTCARVFLPAGAPFRRIPPDPGDDRLLGSLDLAATLSAGRPVAQSGILAEADGGVVVLGMAERTAAGLAARLTAVLDRREVAVARDGIERRQPASIGLIALDEGISDDEQAPPALRDRLAFHVALDTVAVADAVAPAYRHDVVAAARRRLAEVSVDQEILRGLCAAGLALGIASIRPVLLAAKAAQAAAALDRRNSVSAADAATAARLVLAPRATRLPPPAENGEEAEDPQDPAAAKPATEEPAHSSAARQNSRQDASPIEDVVIAAAQAAIPPRLLAQLRFSEHRRPLARPSDGRSSAARYSPHRGRPAGVQRGEPRSPSGNRLNLIETLRAAAPWQRLRRRDSSAPRSGAVRRIEVRPADFRVTRYKQRAQSTVIFVVDASGSAALHRLAEAKGAVELLLAECYIRRDRVALVAFRGARAELLLPPTRSLARARRSLASLPGGGGTPLASGIDAAIAVSDSERRRGGFTAIVLLTDGRANIARDGAPGRPQGRADALDAARAVRAASLQALLIDTAPRPQPDARLLADEMSGIYLPLPYADAAAISQAVRAQGLLAGREVRRSWQTG
jgi:magnesium chelatase subunit D